MLKFQWNALRRGDHVLVHDIDDPKLALRAGVVTLIDTQRSGRDVAIRYTTGTRTLRPVRPGRFAVHFDPLDDDDDGCWRCVENRPPTNDTDAGPDLGSSRQPGR
jgi:hypothetical protein